MLEKPHRSAGAVGSATVLAEPLGVEPTSRSLHATPAHRVAVVLHELELLALDGVASGRVPTWRRRVRKSKVLSKQQPSRGRVASLTLSVNPGRYFVSF